MKITDLVDKLIQKESQTPEKPFVPAHQKRGNRGRFVSKKKKEVPAIVEEQLPVEEKKPRTDLQKEIKISETIHATFYGAAVTKYISDEKTFFLVSDILAMAKPVNGADSITFSPDFEQVKSENITRAGDAEVADAQGILAIIKKVNGDFPGPLSRWLLT